MALRYMSKTNVALVGMIVAVALFLNWADKTEALEHHHWFPGAACYERCVNRVRHDCLHSCSDFEDSPRCRGDDCHEDDDDDDDEEDDRDDDDDDDEEEDDEDDDDNSRNRNRNRNRNDSPRCTGRSCPGNNNDDEDEEEEGDD